jgi:farnesyl diphosphate synthase
MSWTFAAWSQQNQQKVEEALSAWVPAGAPAGLGGAMRYAVLDGGKRLRPLLALAAAEAVQPAGADLPASTLRAACAVELIHAYSLVHDDMPCMDDDVLRRGKPTVHVQYGQAQALLAGDALQALAFDVLVGPANEDTTPHTTVELCRQLARAAGYAGMAGGQAIDLAGVGVRLTQTQLEEMHRLKTGALLLGSVTMGAASVNATTPQLQALTRYGQALGLAFQVVDDVLDVTADAVTLGKTPGKDAAADKPTFVSLLGLEAAQAYADQLLDEALSALDQTFFTRTDALRAIALWVVRRNH